MSECDRIASCHSPLTVFLSANKHTPTPSPYPEHFRTTPDNSSPGLGQHPCQSRTRCARKIYSSRAASGPIFAQPANAAHARHPWLAHRALALFFRLCAAAAAAVMPEIICFRISLSSVFFFLLETHRASPPMACPWVSPPSGVTYRQLSRRDFLLRHTFPPYIKQQDE